MLVVLIPSTNGVLPVVEVDSIVIDGFDIVRIDIVSISAVVMNVDCRISNVVVVALTVRVRDIVTSVVVVVAPRTLDVVRTGTVVRTITYDAYGVEHAPVLVIDGLQREGKLSVLDAFSRHDRRQLQEVARSIPIVTVKVRFGKDEILVGPLGSRLETVPNENARDSARLKFRHCLESRRLREEIDHTPKGYARAGEMSLPVPSIPRGITIGDGSVGHKTPMTHRKNPEAGRKASSRATSGPPPRPSGQSARKRH